MKIKKYIAKGILLSCVALSSVSCSGFLDEVNYSGQSAEEYFATGSGYESLVNGCYSTLKDVYNKKDYHVLSQLGTDIFTQNYSGSVQVLNQYATTFDSNQGNVNAHWNSLYTALKNVNAALDRAPYVILKSEDPDGIEEKVLQQRVAEIKVLRALYLFEIVKNWGQGPLMTNEPTAPTWSAEFASGEEFYTQILQDLEDAIKVLPARYSGNEFGRMSASAARHLRALVYLTRGYESYAGSNDFQHAYSDAVEVIENSGHRLLEDYRLVHQQANEVNDEIIFSIGFSTSANHNTNRWNMWMYFAYREGWQGLSKSAYYGNDDAAAMPTKLGYLLFDWQKDRRASVTFMSPLNGDPATSTDGKDTGKNWFQCTTAVEGVYQLGDRVIYFPVPVEDSFKQWSQSDKDAVVYNVYNYPQGDVTDFTGEDYYKNGYQSSNSTTRAFLPVWKFKDGNTEYKESGDPSGTRDIYLFRLAETCLIAAEAAVKSGDNGNALRYINKVRERAAYGAPQAGLELYSGTVTLDDVLDERALELLGEAPRWNDLQRTRKLAERALRYNWDINNITGGIPTQLTEETFRNKYIRRPIPLSWLNSLSNGQELGNNPGW